MKKMFRKNLYEYLQSQMRPDDVYALYNKHISAMREKIFVSAAENKIKELSEKAFKDAIEGILNS